MESWIRVLFFHWSMGCIVFSNSASVGKTVLQEETGMIFCFFFKYYFVLQVNCIQPERLKVGKEV